MEIEATDILKDPQVIALLNAFAEALAQSCQLDTEATKIFLSDLEDSFSAERETDAAALRYLCKRVQREQQLIPSDETGENPVLEYSLVMFSAGAREIKLSPEVRTFFDQELFDFVHLRVIAVLWRKYHNGNEPLEFFMSRFGVALGKTLFELHLEFPPWLILALKAEDKVELGEYCGLKDQYRGATPEGILARLRLLSKSVRNAINLKFAERFIRVADQKGQTNERKMHDELRPLFGKWIGHQQDLRSTVELILGLRDGKLPV